MGNDSIVGIYDLCETVFDISLIALSIYLAFTQEWFAGGFGWFLLLGLSPRAWRTCHDR